MLINSDIEICNLALIRTGQTTITSFEQTADDSVQATLCRYNYEQSRQSLLSQYPWTFACKEATLTQEESGESIKYAYKYALPADFLRLVQLYDSSDREIIASTDYEPVYSFQGNKILTDLDSCKIKYVHDESNVGMWSPTFKDALVLDLAIRISKVLNDSSSFLQQLQQEFMFTLSRAKVENAKQVQMSPTRSYPLLTQSYQF